MPIGGGTGPRGQGPGAARGLRDTNGIGQGQGFGAGPGGYCVCLTCGYRVAYCLGRPCNYINCPNCGRVMNRDQITVSNDDNL